MSLFPVFHLCVMIYHFISASIYWHWRNISEDPKPISCLNMLFIRNEEQLREYRFTKENLDKFRKTAMKTQHLLIAFMLLTAFAFSLLCANSLWHAYEEVPLIYFACASVPAFVFTVFSYYCLTFAILSIYVLKFTTQAFLCLCAKTYAEEVRYLAEDLVPKVKRLRRALKKTREMKEHQEGLGNVTRELRNWTSREFQPFYGRVQ